MEQGQVVFWGCPLDSDEKNESVEEKRSAMAFEAREADPYHMVMDIIHREVDPELYRELGSLDVPDWLRPIPGPAAGDMVTVEAFVNFIDSGGCRSWAMRAGEFAAERILPNIPCLLGVDHSLTGGVYRRLAERYDPDDLSLIVLDSHLDALTSTALSGAIQYDIETNKQSLYDSRDPFLYNRPDSYNASTFLYYLLEEGALDPQNLFVLGISDYPPPRAFRIKDRRVKDYVKLYAGLKSQGAKIITKKDLVGSPAKLKRILARLDTPYVYFSIDLDIGAGNALNGVRFREWQGINERQLIKTARLVKGILEGGSQLVGLDLTEFNPRLAKDDRTYRIAADLIKILVFGQ